MDQVYYDTSEWPMQVNRHFIMNATEIEYSVSVFQHKALCRHCMQVQKFISRLHIFTITMVTTIGHIP